MKTRLSIAAVLALLYLAVHVGAAPFYSADQVLNQWQTAGYPVSSTSVSAAPAPTTIVTGQASVNSTVAVVVAANASGKGRVVQNDSQKGGAAGVEVWVGPAAVTTSTGYYLAPGQSVSMDGTFAVYAVTASANCSLSWIEVR